MRKLKRRAYICYSYITVEQSIVVSSGKYLTVNNLFFCWISSYFLKKIFWFLSSSKVKKSKYSTFWIYRVGTYGGVYVKIRTMLEKNNNRDFVNFSVVLTIDNDFQILSWCSGAFRKVILWNIGFWLLDLPVLPDRSYDFTCVNSSVR